MASKGLRLRLEIEGDGETVESIRALGERANNAKPVLTVIQKLMEQGAEEQFATKGARGGMSWQVDKDTTIARKVAAGESRDTEVRTGDLARSLLGGGSGSTIRRLSKSSTTYGTRVFYAVFQGHRRQLLRLTTRDADAWSEKMVRWILDGEV